jgi:uncharacterized protein (DUF1697 family)
MSDLRALCDDLKFADARTLMQSGNVVFNCSRRTCESIERLLERQLTERHEMTIDCVVRTTDEWQRIVERNPFTAEAKRDPSHLLVMCMKAAVRAADVDALRAAIVGREVLHAAGRELYLVYPDGIGRSKLSNTLIERKLGVRGTARNWNTVMKLHALAQSLAS